MCVCIYIYKYIYIYICLGQKRLKLSKVKRNINKILYGEIMHS